MACGLRFEPSTIVALDRGYTDYGWFGELTAQGVWFVTRLRANADCVVVEERPTPAGGAVRADQIFSMFQHARQGKDLVFRRIAFWDESQ